MSYTHNLTHCATAWGVRTPESAEKEKEEEDFIVSVFFLPPSFFSLSASLCTPFSRLSHRAENRSFFLLVGVTRLRFFCGLLHACIHSSSRLSFFLLPFLSPVVGQPLTNAQVLLEAGYDAQKGNEEEEERKFSNSGSGSSSFSLFSSLVSILDNRNCFVERHLAGGKGSHHNRPGKELFSLFFMKRITERKERRRENKNARNYLSCFTVSSLTTGEFSFPILPFSSSSLHSLYIKPYQRLPLLQSSSSSRDATAADKQENREEEREVLFSPSEITLERDLLQAQKRKEEAEGVLHFPSVRIKLPSLQVHSFLSFSLSLSSFFHFLFLCEETGEKLAPSLQSLFPF